jgi:hypothetical protein
LIRQSRQYFIGWPSNWFESGRRRPWVPAAAYPQKVVKMILAWKTNLNSAKQRLGLAGFTLIRLPVVIATIAILLAALFKPAAAPPPANSSSQEQFDSQYQQVASETAELLAC